MHEIYRESRHLGYVPTRFPQRVNEQSALVTTHQLLASERNHERFHSPLGYPSARPVA